jgi:8-oxo-dGTP pyrophosphatase MutT (NUDIX family)
VNGRRVQASGGVVTRRAAEVVEVLLVHRPRYDDWTFPKGKVDDGETAEDAARREVWEETGFRVDLGVELPSIDYVDNRGRDKTVRYWLMSVAADDPGLPFAPNDEVDELAWVPLADVPKRLTYPRDDAVWLAARDALR